MLWLIARFHNHYINHLKLPVLMLLCKGLKTVYCEIRDTFLTVYFLTVALRDE